MPRAHDADHRPQPWRGPEPEPDARNTNTAPAAPGAPRAQVQVRLEGAPWLSLRDRCGQAQDAPGASRRSRSSHGRSSHRRGASGSPAGSGWRSLSRLEVAVGLVLLALLSAVFRGAQHEPALALSLPEAAAEAPAVAPVSLVE